MVARAKLRRSPTVSSVASPESVARAKAIAESAFAKARENYMYRQTARIQEYDVSGVPGGKFERDLWHR